MVHRYIRARLGGGPFGDDGAADDAAQEVCIAVLSALPRYRDEGVPFEAFVYSIAARKLADVYRAAGRRAVPVAEVPDGIDLTDGPEAMAVRSSDADLARALLSTLPDQQREILLLRVAVGMSAEETGRALSLTPGAVRVAQHRALRRLRENAASMVDLREHLSGSPAGVPAGAAGAAPDTHSSASVDAVDAVRPEAATRRRVGR